ncbi:hypothetical protein CHU98_g12537, partial [Xylaria longipes]
IACSLRGQNDASPHPGPAEAYRPGVEERYGYCWLQRHEDALQEIKAMIQALGSERQGSSRSSRANADSDGPEEGAPAASHDPPDPEYLLNPVDRGSKSAPIVVLREISQHVTLGYRRMVGHGNPDLVQLQLLDEQTASELIELFIKYQGHTLLVRDYEELRHCSDARQVSAFLHSVCCLIGVVYRDDICGTPLHRQIYEQVRITLGQAMLCSPLDMDDLNAMFIMSNNANTPSSPTQKRELDDRRPPSHASLVNDMPPSPSMGRDNRSAFYHSEGVTHQSVQLLSFYQATMQDGMLVAEIMLYSILHQKILQESYPSDGRECEEFRTWKQRWNHLLGYNAACLILAVRALGKTGDALGSTSLLSTDNTPVTGSASIGSKTDDKTPASTERRDSNWAESETIREETSHSTSDGKADGTATDLLRVNVCKYAKLVLETFLEMPLFLRDTAPTCTCLCLGYCALVLAHYDATQSQIPNAVILRLIMRLDQWVQTSPGKAWSYKYGALAIRKVEARANSPPAFSNSRAEADFADHGPGESAHRRADLAAASQVCQDDTRGPSAGHVHAYPTDDMLTSAGHAVDPNDVLPSFDLGLGFLSLSKFLSSCSYPLSRGSDSEHAVEVRHFEIGFGYQLRLELDKLPEGKY